MKWINHTIVAGSLTAMINPLAVPAAIVGGSEVGKEAPNPPCYIYL